MSKRTKLTKFENATLRQEKEAAEAFLCSRMKPKGAIQYVNDGKTDLYAKVKWADLVTLLYSHAIERLVARTPQIRGGEQ